MISHYLTRLTGYDAKKISLRVREEDDRRILTVKVMGIQNGLHQRPEWSLALEDDWRIFCKPAWIPNGFIGTRQGDSDDQLHEILTGWTVNLVEIGRIHLPDGFYVGYATR